MKLIRSTEPVLTHEERFNLQMNYQQLYDLRSMLYLMRNGCAVQANEFYSDIVSSIIEATNNHER